jgi:SAM-dependent methyltransferase
VTDPEGPLPRFVAGGRHVRMLIVGQLPPALVLPDLSACERVMRVAAAAPADAIADPLRLPFIEALFDRVLLASPLADPRGLLRETWRVMAPAGLALFVVPARRPWQLAKQGWAGDALADALADGMFEVLARVVVTVPDRHHLMLAAKCDGLAPIGPTPITATAAATATALPCETP